MIIALVLLLLFSSSMCNNSIDSISANSVKTAHKIDGLYGGIGIDVTGFIMFRHAAYNNVIVSPLIQSLYCTNLQLVHLGKDYGIIANCQPYEKISITLWNRKLNETELKGFKLIYGLEINIFYSAFYKHRRNRSYSDTPSDRIIITDKIISPVYLIQGLNIFYCLPKHILLHINISSKNGGLYGQNIEKFALADLIPKIAFGLIKNLLDLDKIEDRNFRTVMKMVYYIAGSFSITLDIATIFIHLAFESHIPRSIQLEQDKQICISQEFKDEIGSIGRTYIFFPDANNSNKIAFMGSVIQPRITITITKKLSRK